VGDSAVKGFSVEERLSGMLQSRDRGTTVAGGRGLANGAAGLKPQPFTMMEILYLDVTEGELVCGQDLFPVFDLVVLLFRPTLELSPISPNNREQPVGKGREMIMLGRTG
jgi:hypothetical protein